MMVAVVAAMTVEMMPRTRTCVRRTRVERSLASAFDSAPTPAISPASPDARQAPV